jgi:hypothetical protein
VKAKEPEVTPDPNDANNMIMLRKDVGGNATIVPLVDLTSRPSAEPMHSQKGNLFTSQNRIEWTTP